MKETLSHCPKKPGSAKNSHRTGQDRTPVVICHWWSRTAVPIQASRVLHHLTPSLPKPRLLQPKICTGCHNTNSGLISAQYSVLKHIGSRSSRVMFMTKPSSRLPLATTWSICSSKENFVSIDKTKCWLKYLQRECRASVLMLMHTRVVPRFFTFWVAVVNPFFSTCHHAMKQ